MNKLDELEVLLAKSNATGNWSSEAGLMDKLFKNAPALLAIAQAATDCLFRYRARLGRLAPEMEPLREALDKLETDQ